MKSVKEKLEALIDYSATDGLPEWEEDFVSGLEKWMKNCGWATDRMSDRQVDKIEELYERRIIRGTGQRRFHEH